ncbi:MAG: hypothetical protein LBL35_03995 [Clostridiales bacterium]|nr:hypothetical protein [Clostridiales bacterium]
MKTKSAVRPAPLIIPITVALFNILIIMFPSEALSAAKDGISLWFNGVLPSLLPFLIGANVLAGLGFISFAGTLLEPVTRRCFGVPGCGAFALVTGMTSGYPVGAKTVALLRETNELTKTEAQRLAAFCNNSGPLFMIGVIGAGMYGSARVGWFIAICHFAAAFLTGFSLKFYKREKTLAGAERGERLNRAFLNMAETRRKDGRPFGAVLGGGVKNAVETVTVIGGFIILFSVIVKMLEITDVFYIVKNVLPSSASDAAAGAVVVGVIEVTNGVKALSIGIDGFTRTSAVLSVALVSFGGASIHAQSIGFFKNTDINPFLYVASKALHAAIGAALAWAAYPFAALDAARSEQTLMVFKNAPIETFWRSALIFAVTTAALPALALFTNIPSLFAKRKRPGF